MAGARSLYREGSFVAAEPEAVARPVLWGKVLDQDRCIGCHACTVACKSENEVAMGVTRTFVKQVEIGMYPNVRRQFQVTRCNQCTDPPCVAACPVTAMFQRPDGIVDFDRDVCIGCKACIAACPYDAIFIDPETHSAEKCNFCAHRIDQGLQPACVSVCPEGAIIVGDISDPDSEISRLLSRGRVEVRKPHARTNPKVFYKGGDVAALDPTRAVPRGMFNTAAARARSTPRPAPAPAPRSSAAALLAYDNKHTMPWDWRVSLYTWTKSLAGGVFGLGAALSLALHGGAALQGTTAAISLFFLAATLALIVSDLEHPTRFYRILVRPQWRSWLARGAFILTGYAGVLALELLGWITGAPGLMAGLRIPGIVLGALSAAYTGFMFAQCRGRDLWQSQSLPAALVVQAAVAGSAALLLLGAVHPLPAGWVGALRPILLASVSAHLLLLVVEGLVSPHTADALAAGRQMRRGVYAVWYWAGTAGGALLPLILVAAGTPGPAAVLALLGLLPYQHAFVQAGQSVALS
jgi:Fe-S-cluster-containing dehydrogenase component/formate-dependent nitrite reductase membrane component NrfD